MTSSGIRRPVANSFIPYRKVLGGALAEARDTELPFMIPILDPVYCWHWNDITFFSEYPIDKLSKWHIRATIEADDHLFIYALKPSSMTGAIQEVVEENLAVGRSLLIGHVTDGVMSYSTLKTDKIKTRNIT